jgi:hypothetical protein
MKKTIVLSILLILAFSHAIQGAHYWKHNNGLWSYAQSGSVWGGDSLEVTTSATTGTLFIGNSYTGSHELDEVFSNIVVSVGASSYVVGLNWTGGQDIRYHYENPIASNLVVTGNFENVVIQDYSSTAWEPARRAEFETYVPLWKDFIEENDATMYLFETWARQTNILEDGYASSQTNISAMYDNAGAINNIEVSPAGRAFKKVYEQNEYISTPMHNPDGAHPSPYGSYLAALTHYATIFDTSPEGIAYYGEVSEQNEAEFLQRIAWDTYLELQGDYDATEVTYSVSTNSITTDENITFIGSSVGATNYVLSFGDGSSSNGATDSFNITHSYTLPEVYDSYATLYDADGDIQRLGTWIQVTSSVAVALSERILVDFNNGMASPSEYNMTDAANDTIPDLVKTNGVNSGYAMTMTDWNSMTTAGVATNILYHENAQGDTVYVQSGNDPAYVILSDLDLTSYNLTLFASRGGSGDRYSRYTVTGTTVSTNHINVLGNEDTAVTFESITPYTTGGTNYISIRVDALDPAGSASSYAYLGVLDLSWTGNNQAPIITSLTPDKTTVLTNEVVAFTTASSDADGSITNYVWNFDDTNTSNGPTLDAINYAWQSSGVYDVQFTVYDNEGVTASSNVTITVTNTLGAFTEGFYAAAYDLGFIYEFDTNFTYTGNSHELAAIYNSGSSGQIFWGEGSPRDISLSTNGTMYVYDGGYGSRIYAIDTSDWTIDETFVGGSPYYLDVRSIDRTGESIEFNDTDGILYYAGRSNIVYGFDVSTGSIVSSNDLSAQFSGGSSMVASMRVGSDGNWYTVDNFLDNFHIYDSSWNHIRSTSTLHTGSSLGVNVYAITERGDGSWITFDIGNDNVDVYDSTLTYAQTYDFDTIVASLGEDIFTGLEWVPQAEAMTLTPGLEESFEDYTVGVGLNGQNGGTGWIAGWSAQNSVDAAWYVQDTPAFTDDFGLTVSDKYLQGGYAYQAIGRAMGTYDTGVHWISFLFERGATPGATTFTFHRRTNDPEIAGDLGFIINISNGNWALGDGTTSDETSVPAAVGTYLFVVKVTFGTTDDVELFINPTKGVTPTAAAATITGSADLSFAAFRFYPGSQVGDGAIDEIRIGDSYDAVTQ